ncbi:alpha/beta fold hydrolase [Thalassotalea crassostreae]|uniref:alpha/beta fold hydrolase n=1 Tax=Thalassotalea crassostreae TaxID=1763536 RepID=UPI00083864F8|nr:alpha/beta fold hydrolase [Thalassotalea crassostreae]
MVTEQRFTQEHLLKQRMPQIEQLWQTGVFSSFNTPEQIKIHYALISKAELNDWIVIAPGRSESYLKYKEVVFDLIGNGYNVAIIDHRGQGLSQRELDEPHKGYVKDFNDYTTDFNHFITEIVQPQCTGQLFLLAHSMGANISARFLAQTNLDIAAAILMAPMIAIDAGIFPNWLGRLVVSVGYFFDRLFNKQSAYFFGRGQYKDKVFKGSDLMQSEVRFNYFRDLYKNDKRIQLGGVTFAWLNAAIQSEDFIMQNLTTLKTPVTVMQAGDDNVVCNKIQDKFCQQLNTLHPNSCPNGTTTIIKGAKHELLFEKDEYRNQALTKTLDWFNQHKT